MGVLAAAEPVGGAGPLAGAHRPLPRSHFLECDPPPADLPTEDIVGMMGGAHREAGAARVGDLVNWEVNASPRQVAPRAPPDPRPSRRSFPTASPSATRSKPEMSEALNLCGASVMASYVLVERILSGQVRAGRWRGAHRRAPRRPADGLRDRRGARAARAGRAPRRAARRPGDGVRAVQPAGVDDPHRRRRGRSRSTRTSARSTSSRGLGEEDLAALKAVGAPRAASSSARSRRRGCRPCSDGPPRGGWSEPAWPAATR